MTNYLAVRDGGKTNEEGAMRIFRKIYTTLGIVGADDYEVSQKSTPDMSVDVATGDALIEYLTYAYHVWSNAVNNVAIASNSSGNTRKDAVVLWVDLTVVSSASNNNPGASKVTVVQGTPAGSPVAPTDGEIQAEIGASNPFIRLGNVTVASGASSITDANIASTRTFVENGAGGGSASFWNEMPEATRVSNTQFTIADAANVNKYDLLFQKGVILRWTESGTFKTGMIISSSYASNVVTINLLGDAFGATFLALEYCLQMIMTETFIIAGTFPSSATTNLSKTWIPYADMYLLSADLVVDTAGSGSGSTVVDINDDGTTKFTTKPTLTTTGVSDLDNVADNPSTAVAKQSLITVDVDSVTATTVPSNGYVTLYYYPISWRYRE